MPASSSTTTTSRPPRTSARWRIETPYEADSSTWSLAFDEGGGAGALALVLTFAALGAVVGALPFRWSGTPRRTGARALALAVAGVLSVPVFWTGLPVVLGSGATALALRDRHQASSWSASRGAALALGVALLALAG